MNNNTLVINSIGLMNEAKEYWINVLEGDIEETVLPADYTRNLTANYKEHRLEIGREECITLTKVSGGDDLGLYMVLLSAFLVEMHKFSSKNNMLIGISEYLKNEELKFVNKLLPFKNQLNEEMSFKDLILQTRDRVLISFKHQVFPVSEILNGKNVSDLREILNVNFFMKNINSQEIINYLLEKPNNEVAFIIDKQSEHIYVDILYNSNFFNFDTIDNFGNTFLKILKQGLNNSNEKIKDFEIISEANKNQILNVFNDTSCQYEKTKRVEELFEEQAERFPDNIAVICEDKKITYKELNERANELAVALYKRGVEPGDIVGIMVNRSIEMLISIVAILKSGGAYLPIDHDYPKERIDYMLEDSNAKVLITEKEYINTISYKGEILDIHQEESYSKEISNIKRVKNTNDLAYIIYTSGTTGKPKGVMIGHNQIINFIQGICEKVNITDYRTMLCITTIAFDMAVTETLLPLAVGRTIVLSSNYTDIDGDKIGELIEKNSIDIIESTPSRIKLLMENDSFKKSIKKLKVMLIGGDAMTSSLYDTLSEYNNLKIFNMYGPTETTVWSTMKEITEKHEINIGKPIQNTKVYILDNNMKLQPIGVAGELYIGGEGLAKGYINNVQLTSEKFVDNPYEKGTKIYKTGDVAKWLLNGDIMYLGRNDYQVKVRGYRIELGEIENALLDIDGIKDAVVVAKEDNEMKHLCAYYVSETKYTSAELREKLIKNIPEYMIPSFFIKLESIPTTYNGKVNRKELIKREIEKNNLSIYELPQDMLQVKLIDIWKQALAVKTIGISDSFFDLGGNSLTGTALVARINAELGMNISIRDIFSQENIKNLSEYIKFKEIDEYEEIEELEEKEFYEVSPAQKRMYILKALDEENVAYNIPIALIFKGRLDIKKFEEVIKELIKRHESLRSSFHVNEGGIMQKIHKSDEVAFKLQILKKRDEDNLEDIVQDFIQPFYLEQSPLFRIALVELGPDENMVLIDMHHIVSDALSMKILAKDFLKLYSGDKLDNLDIQYKEYSLWQNRLSQKQDYKKQEEFWCKLFENSRPVLNLPTDYARPRVKSYKGDNLRFEIGENEVLELKKIARENNSTLFMVLFSVYVIMLSKFSGQEEVVAGIPMAVRRRKEFEEIMGIFANTLPFVARIDGEMNYIDLLQQIRQMTLDMHENQDFQFEDLVEKLNIKRDLSREPLYDVVFTFQNADNQEAEVEDFLVEEYESKYKTSKFDLKLIGIEYEKSILFELEYATDLFKQETAEKIRGMYEQILRQIIQSDRILIKHIDILEEKEREWILNEYNNTSIHFENEKTINRLFEEQVEKTPENMAVILGNEKISYRQLNEKANRLARMLVEQGAGKGTVVSIMLERSIDLIVGIIAILKSGAAYVPVDPAYPVDRVNYILKNSHSELLIVEKSFKHADEVYGRVLTIDSEMLNNYSNNNLEARNDKWDIAYIIYTSGSTGTPKGVIITHEAAVNTLIDINTKFNIKEADRLALISSICFDLSVYDIFGALIYGAGVVIIKDRLNPKEMREVVERENISVWNTVPSIMEMFVDSMESELEHQQLRLVLLSGDWIPLNLPGKIKKYFPEAQTISLGGATEGSVWSIYFPINKVEANWRSIPYGMPLANQKMYILDKYQNLLPVGVPGDIYIGGIGVAKGYMNDPEKTNTSFFNHKSLGYIYRTGDMGVLKVEGYIEFLGRNDNQVKIRGYRIELGEVENCMLDIEGVKEAVVIHKKSKNDYYICAFYVADKKLEKFYLIDEIKKKLPEYMIPVQFIQIDKIPLTYNGKVDKKSLPEPALTVKQGAEYEAPRDKTEEILMKMWMDILGVENIGVNDNFFDLGGNSLKAILLISKIHKELNIEISFKEIYTLQTISDLSEFIADAEKSEYKVIPKTEKQEYYPLSRDQKRLFISNQMHEKDISYNMPTAFNIEGDLDIERIQSTIKKLIRRHEVFRTSFHFINGEPVQRISEDCSIKINMVHSENRDVAEVIKSLIIPFDLSQAPLLRVNCIKINEKQHVLFFDVHHIIFDGISMQIFMREFQSLYQGNTLNELDIQYKDFCVWQNGLFTPKYMDKLKEYWLDKLKGFAPTNFTPRYNSQQLVGISQNMEMCFGNKDYSKISKYCSSNSITKFTYFTSILNIILMNEIGTEDITIGTPVSGRKHNQLQNIVGLFLNVLLLRTKVDKKLKFNEYLQSVNSTIIDLLNQEQYPYEELYDLICEELNFTGKSLFSIMINYVPYQDNNNEKQDVFSGASLEEYINIDIESKYDATFYIKEGKEQILIDIVYKRHVFEDYVIKRILKAFQYLSNMILDNSDIIIKDIEYSKVMDDVEEEMDMQFSNTDLF